MSAPGNNAVDPLAQAVGDFSLVLGGPLYQLWRRTRLAGDTCNNYCFAASSADRAGLAAVAVVVGRRRARLGESVTLPFLHDVEYMCVCCSRSRC